MLLKGGGKRIRSLILVFFLMISLVFLSIPTKSASAEGLGSWSKTTSYPVNVYLHDCVSYSEYVYCVGGYNGTSYIDSTFYAQLTSSGVGAWVKTTSYPAMADYVKCVANSGYIYCVGGSANNGYLGSVYYAQLSSSGIGSWSPSSNYPISAYDMGCVASSGYIYCVGGYDGIEVSNVYYAQLSSNGVSTWQQTTRYPENIAFGSCFASSGYLYCLAGSSTGYTALNYTDVAFYASLSSNGVGQWTQTTSYPLSVIDPACVVYSAVAYCVGGENNAYNPNTVNSTYYALLSAGGIGPWQTTESYPTIIVGESCVANLNYEYCVAGQNKTLSNTVYYSNFLNPTTTSMRCAKDSLQINSTVTCTAVVGGSDPTGTVDWASNNTSSFSSSACTLSAGSCSVNFTPRSSGHVEITAAYSGYSSNAQSSGSFVLNVVSGTGTEGPGGIIVLAILVAVIVIAVAASLFILKQRR